MTTPWWLILCGGLLGSSHCIGMCGGFAIMLGVNRTSLSQNLKGQILYSCGRLVTYGTLGGIAGFAGRTLSHQASILVNVPAILSFGAGIFLLWEGVRAAGWWRTRVNGNSTMGCLMGPLFTTLLKHPGLRNAFCAGIFTGLLPCGLVYAFLSLAAATGDLLQGGAVMLAFGAGTIPLMVLTGTGAMLLSVPLRRWLWRMAAWSVVATGLLTVGRGIAFFQPGGSAAPAACPFCSHAENSIPSSVSQDHIDAL